MSADLSRRALNTLYFILKTPLYLRPGLKFGHVAKHIVKQVRNSSNSLKLAREGWGWGGGGVRPSGSHQVVRSTKRVLLTFRRSAACSPKIPHERFRSTKTMFPESQNAQALHSQCFHSFWRSKDGFRSTKIVFACLRNAQNSINPLRFNQIDLQESLLEHQLNTFQMCPDGVSSCNSVPHIKSIALVVQMHTNIT